MVIYSGIIFVLFCIFSFWGCHKAQNRCNAYLSKEQTVCLKGILAIEVLLCHIYAYYPKGLAMRGFNALAYLAVAMFFLFSGFGLVLNVITKSGYLVGFIKKRMRALYIPLWSSLLVVGVFSTLLGVNSPITLERFTKDVLGLNAIWFFRVIIVYYFAFWLIWKHVPKKKRLVVLTEFVFAQCVICFLLKLNMQYYTSSFGFLLGAWLAKDCAGGFPKLKNLEVMFWKNPVRMILLGAIVTIISGVGYIFLGDVPLIGDLIFRNMIGICLIVLTMAALWMVHIGNPVCHFIGRCSYEIFLVHPGVIIAIKKYSENQIPDWIQIIVIIIVTVLLSVIVKSVSRFINTWLDKQF